MQYCQVESNCFSQQSVGVVISELDKTVSTSEPLHIESSSPSIAEFPSDMAHYQKFEVRNGMTSKQRNLQPEMRSHAKNQRDADSAYHVAGMLCC